MQKITYVPPDGNYGNPDDCVELEFGEPYILSSLDGVSGVEYDIISATIAGIDGVEVLGIRTDGRDIPCSVYVRGKSRREMYQCRLELISKLTPRASPGTLYYSNDYLNVKIAAYPRLPPNFTERIKNYNKCSINFFAPYPYWSDLDPTIATLVYAPEDNSFSFPLAFEDTISFTDSRTELVIDYNGSVPSPVVITLTGDILSPRITNETTGDSLCLEDIMLDSGALLTINTKRGEKSVEVTKNGTTENKINLVSPMSKFWELQPGRNIISYSSQKGISSMTATVEYYNLYSGV